MNYEATRQALERLREGNARFVAGVRSLEAMLSQTRRGALAAEQHPFAIVPRLLRLASPR